MNGDNGNKEHPEQKSNLPPQPQELLRVDLVGTTLIPKINTTQSTSLPMLCFAITLLEVEIQKMIINIQIMTQQQNQPKIHKPQGFLNFGRRK